MLASVEVEAEEGEEEGVEGVVGKEGEEVVVGLVLAGTELLF